MPATKRRSPLAPGVPRTGQKTRPAVKPASGVAPLRAVAAVQLFDFRQVYLAASAARISVIRRGVLARAVGELAASMKTSEDELIRRLGLKHTTVSRKVEVGRRLSPEQSERIVGLARLIGQVQTIVQQSGEPERFDAAIWVGNWLSHPNPALGGQHPGEFLDTIEGLGLLGSLIARMQSGAYA
ncbi:antitoxin Xre-like helix-turn-helix domain-containing protein [Paraburkholderia sp. EG285A]|uniref:antitoxin Xre-like helix-turn-helix domain-containing protein n=1 Tax=Paraburkholderia sp. EG285A TaxID=3237009 RepID=UPI0034D22A6C